MRAEAVGSVDETAIFREDDMTIPDPTGNPDVERPIDITDVPDSDRPQPAPTPEHHPPPDPAAPDGPDDPPGTDAPLPA